MKVSAMKLKTFSVATIVTLIGVAVLSENAPASIKKVDVTLYYETHCPHSRGFIMNHLVPTWQIFSHYMNVQLVPYGLTKRKLVDGKWKFSCQHGQEECNMDMVSACAVEMFADNPIKLMEFIYCIEENIFNMPSVNNTVLCSKKSDIEVKNIADCVANSEEMMLRFAHKTEVVVPAVRALPALGVNGVYDPSSQRLYRRDLIGEVCRLLPNCFTTTTLSNETAKEQNAITQRTTKRTTPQWHIVEVNDFEDSE